MSTSFLSSVKAFFLFLLHLFLTALFAWLTWAFWGLYQQEKRTSEFQKDGQSVVVTVSSYSNNKQVWTDYIQNSKYINFQYKGHNYNTRYVQDSAFVSEGSSVMLLYHPTYDAFLQPQKLVYTPRSNVSKLIGWTSASLLSKKNIALMSFLFIAIAFFFLLAGLLARIPGFSFITTIAGWVFRVLLCLGAIYLTYNAISYYQYYQHIKKMGTPQAVVIEDKGKHYVYRESTRSNGFIFFNIIYTATVNFHEAVREIPVSEDDYNKIEKGSRLNVLYDTELNDMMAADYKMNPLIFISTVILWIVLLYFIITKKEKVAYCYLKQMQVSLFIACNF